MDGNVDQSLPNPGMYLLKRNEAAFCDVMTSHIVDLLPIV